MVTTRTPIAEIRPGAAGITILAECISPEIRKTSKGADYFQMTLRDRSGSIGVRIWTPRKLPDGSGYVEDSELKHGDIASFEIQEVKDWNGYTQVTKFDEFTVMNPDESGYAEAKEKVSTAPTRKELDVYFALMKKMLSDISHPALRKMCLAFLKERTEDIRSYPGAPHEDGHHGYDGGYLIHVTSVMRLARFHAQKVLNGKFVSTDVVVAGAFFHDIGKFDTYASRRLKRTRDGILLGHIVLGIPVLSALCEKFEVDKETASMLLHILISHHGKREFGSPEKPMTIEAEIVCWADMADSKVEGVRMKLAGGLTPSDWKGNAQYGKHTAYVQPEFDGEEG